MVYFYISSRISPGIIHWEDDVEAEAQYFGLGERDDYFERGRYQASSRRRGQRSQLNVHHNSMDMETSGLWEVGDRQKSGVPQFMGSQKDTTE